MDDKTNSRPVLTRAVRWAARIWAVASIGLVLAFLVGEGFHPSQIQPREWLGLVFFPVGICTGMILAWWKEGLGGAITVGSLAVFYLIHLATAGTYCVYCYEAVLLRHRQCGVGRLGPES
jgi:hypothetical protein